MSDGAATARSRSYSLLATAVSFPEREFFDGLGNGSFARSLGEAAAGLPFSIDLGGLGVAAAGAAGTTYELFQSSYIQTFEVGAAGPPCPLYGGIYLGGRTQVWEELLRFYGHFGLHLSPENRDLPDHLATQLEFLHYLAHREAGEERHAADLRRAERDFLQRHPCRWLPQLAARIMKKDAPEFYRELTRLVLSFCQADVEYLAALVPLGTGQSALAGRGRGKATSN